MLFIFFTAPKDSKGVAPKVSPILSVPQHFCKRSLSHVILALQGQQLLSR